MGLFFPFGMWSGINIRNITVHGFLACPVRSGDTTSCGECLLPEFYTGAFLFLVFHLAGFRRTSYCRAFRHLPSFPALEQRLNSFPIALSEVVEDIRWVTTSIPWCFPLFVQRLLWAYLWERHGSVPISQQTNPADNDKCVSTLPASAHPPCPTIV